MSDTCPHGHTRPLNSCSVCIAAARDAFKAQPTRENYRALYASTTPAYLPATHDAVALVGMAIDAAAEAVRTAEEDDRREDDGIRVAPVTRAAVLAVLRAVLSIDGPDAGDVLNAALSDGES